MFNTTYNAACTQLCGQSLPAPSVFEVFNDNQNPNNYTVEFINGILYIGNLTIPYRNIVGVPALIKPATAVAQVVELVPIVETGCCDSYITYGVTLTWVNNCGSNFTETYTTRLCCGSYAVNDIIVGLIASIVADPNAPVIPTALGSVGSYTTLVLTAVTAGQGFNTNVSLSQFPAGVDIVTPNTQEFGNPADFINGLNIPASDFVLTATYELLIISYYAITPDSANPKAIHVQGVEVQTAYIFVQTGGTSVQYVLTNADKLCSIMAGTYTPASAYYAVYSGICS